MRPIKFRAWDKEQKRWLNILALHCERGLAKSIEYYIGTRFDISDIELMQFTGLLDKNGKEIYEGDVIKLDDSFGAHICEVIWEKGRFVCKHFNNKNIGTPLFFCVEESKLIGNIYENPELLEKSNES